MAIQQSITPERIQELRRMPYGDYLLTAEWAERASERRAIAHWKCEECGRKRPLDVHHLTYVRRGSERMEDLQALCRPCHKAAEQDKRFLRQWATMTLAEAQELEVYDGYLLWILRAVAAGACRTPVLSAADIRELSGGSIKQKQIGISSHRLAKAGKVSTMRKAGGIVYILLDTETSPEWRKRRIGSS